MFNNNLTVLPLLTSFVAILSLHSTSCLRDIKWKKKFSYLSLAYICFPLIFSFCVYTVNSQYQIEQKTLYEGANYLSKGNFIKSRDLFEKAIKSNSQSIRAYYGLGISLNMLGKLQKSQEIFTKLDAMVPNVFNAKLELAKILLERKKILEAHQYILKSLDWGRSLVSYEILGKVLLLEGKTSEAKQILEESLVFVPISNLKEANALVRIKLLLASISAAQGNFKEAEHFLQNVKNVPSEISEFMYLKGLIFYHKKNFKKALTFFERALRKKPDNPDYMNAVGYLLTKENINLTRAERLLEKAYLIYRNQHPTKLSDILTVSNSLGMLYWKQKKLLRAEKLLFLAYSECPKSWTKKRTERLHSLVNFLKQNGKEDEAIKLEKENKLDTKGNKGSKEDEK